MEGLFLMTILLIVIYSYSLLNLFIGILQLNKHLIPPPSNSILFVLGSISILITLFSIKYPLLFLIAGFVLIQIGAILNGIHLNGKVTLSHQLIRFIFGLIIIILYSNFM